MNEKFEACKQHNKDLFTECKIINLDEKLQSTLVSQGTLCFKHKYGTAVRRHRSGVLTVAFDERDIKQTTESVTSKTEGGITKFGLSMTQAVSTTFSSMKRTENGSSVTSDLDFEVEQGRTASVQPYFVIYEMETPLEGLIVELPSNSKLSYHKKGGNCPIGRCNINLTEKMVKISGIHRWLRSEVVAHVVYIFDRTS